MFVVAFSTADMMYVRVYSRNWPMKAQWALFCNFRGSFFKKGGHFGTL